MMQRRRLLLPTLSLLALAGMDALAFGVDPPITAVAFAPDEKHVVAGSQRGVQLYSWPELAPVGKLESRLVQVHDLAFSPDGSQLAVAGGKPAESGELEIFAWPEKSNRLRLTCHADCVAAIAWRSDGKYLATAGMDHQAALVDLVQNKVARNFQGHSAGVLAAAFVSQDLLVTAGADLSLRVWDVATGRQVRSMENHTRPVLALARRPAQQEPSVWLASIGEDRTVRLWQPVIGRLVRFARLEQLPLCVAWTADGQRLLAGGADGVLRVIDPGTAGIVREVTVSEARIISIAAAPSGDCVAGCRDGQLYRVLAAQLR